MASNKYLIADKSQLLKTKLEKISTKLQSSLGSKEFQTKEQYMMEAIKALQEFYLDLNEPSLTENDIKLIHEDDLPNPELFNFVWNKVIDDLIVIFTELENVEQLTLANFNFITTEANRLTARLKKVSSLLGDYILYTDNPSKDSIFFKDSFNDLSKIESLSPLLNTDQCEINQTEGIVTLPIEKTQSAIVRVREIPLINPNSNGVVGNNQQIGAKFRGTITDILDGNPDTWFEYENVITSMSDDVEPLILDLTLNLGEEQVINNIRINPNNFGTKTVVKINSIDTSLDGKVYTSIKDDIPIGDFVSEDEENIFTLAPSTSKFAGQGIYTFTPRKVKYVRLVLQQSEPYIISTASGNKLRYAIGLRDIELKNYKYKPIGEIVSVPFELLDEVRKVSIQSNQNPSQLSELASITWQVSPDNGSSWFDIQPQDFPGLSGRESTPEVLEFNGPSENTIETDVPVYSLRVKAIIERADPAFEEGSSTLHKNRVNASEPYQIPSNSPYTIDLVNSPIDGTVSLIDPLFGSRGIPESPYVVGHAGNDQRKFRLPFTNLPRPVKKVLISANKWKTEPVPASEWMHIEVGGEEWSQAPSGLNTYQANYSSANDYRLYTFNPATAELEFGNGINTLSPNEDADITLYFDSEKLFLSEEQDNHIARLDFSTSNNKDDVVIKRFAAEESATEIVPRKATILRLRNKNITNYTTLSAKLQSMLLTLTGTNGLEKSFINGRDELVDSFDWSIDVDEGVVFLRTPTPDDSDVSISYKYKEIITLTTDEWDWADTDGLKDSISIKESAWKTLDIEDETIATVSGITVFDVANLCLVKGSLAFTVTDELDEELTDEDATYPFVKEVDYLDGVTELGKQLTKTIETIPTLSAGTNYIDLKENVLQGSEDNIIFSNTSIFASQQVSDGAVNSVGEYYVETDPVSPNYGKVKVITSAITTNPGTITYFFGTATYSDNGLYSVNYKEGRIFCQRPVLTDWTLQASYSYTDYEAEYRIARSLDPNGYDVDIVNKTVTIKDNEVLKRALMPNSGNNYYIVNYDYVGETRENIGELKESFSPVIKDYALRVVTKGKIF